VRISGKTAGVKAQMKLLFDAAEMQAKGTPPEELKKIIQQRYKTAPMLPDLQLPFASA
jgi:hypothetical protein